MKNKIKVLVLLGMLLSATLSIASAEFGQTAGVLDFGTLKLGENKTLTYWVVNPGETTIDVNTYYVGNTVSVSPANFTLVPHSQQQIDVTATAEHLGSFSGKVRALGHERGASGVVVLQTEMEKNFVYKVSLSLKTEVCLLLIALTIIFILLYIVYESIIRRRR